MIVHRLLDGFFKTLDAVDAVRDRVDRVLGREPRPDPWAVEWPPADTDLPQGAEAEPEAEEKAPPKKGAAEEGRRSSEAPAPAPKEKPEAKRKSAPAQKQTAAKKKPSEAAKPRPAAKKTAGAKKGSAAKKTSSSRKGSVDRSGKDFDSPRAQAIHDFLTREKVGVVTEDAEIDGKKVLGRVVWALGAAHDAGSELGLTTGDTSALLHLSAGMEVFATNIGRACRDHKELIEESEPDGRSKRYRLTEQGRERARMIETRPVGKAPR